MTDSVPPTIPDNAIPDPPAPPDSFPGVADIAVELVVGSVDHIHGDQPVDVRLQVYPGGNGWAIHWGDPSFDPDHLGYWGAGSVDCPISQADAVALAEDLRDQAVDDYYIR